MGKKAVVFLLLALLLVLFGGLWLFVWGYGMEDTVPDDVHVIFVPGFWTEDNDPSMYERLLSDVFPESKVTVRMWPSKSSWDRAKLQADLLAGELVKEIYAMTDAERGNLVLVGHSVGGRVVVKAMADLNGFGMSIRRGVFLGAALPDNDANIPKALQASIRPCINISNRKDCVLSVIYSSILGDFEECALGAYGSKVKYPKMSLIDVKMRERNEETLFAENVWDVLKIIIKNNLNNYQRHYVELYFDELKNVFENEEISSVLSPPLRMRRFSRKFDFWKTIAKSHGWELRRHSLSRQLCIVNSHGVMHVVGDSTTIRGMFEELKQELQDADLRNNINIVVKQDEHVEVEKVFPIDALWKTMDEYDGWMLQKLKIGNSFRIVDTRDYIRAAGSEEKMREAFKDIREQLTNGIMM